MSGGANFQVQTMSCSKFRQSVETKRRNPRPPSLPSPALTVTSLDLPSIRLHAFVFHLHSCCPCLLILEGCRLVRITLHESLLILLDFRLQFNQSIEHFVSMCRFQPKSFPHHVSLLSPSRVHKTLSTASAMVV